MKQKVNFFNMYETNRKTDLKAWGGYKKKTKTLQL